MNDESKTPELLRCSHVRPIYRRGTYRRDKPIKHRPAFFANLWRIIRDHPLKIFRRRLHVVTQPARTVDLYLVAKADAREEIETEGLALRQDAKTNQLIDEHPADGIGW